MIFRVDYAGPLRNIRKTPQGGIQAPGYLTRVGVFTYKNANGDESRELRHPDEVFKADSLNSLSGAPVTIDHPGEVNSSNWQKHAVGHVGDEVRQDGKYVAATVRVQDHNAVKAVQARGLVEFSCGYTCDLDPTPGEFEGERYDAVQRNIVYNHVALGPKGWGRAGEEVKLRCDSSYAFLESAPDVSQRISNQLDLPMADSNELKNAVERADSAVERAAKATARYDDLKSEFEKLKGSHDATVAELSKLKADSAEWGSQTRIDSLVAAKMALQAQATKVLGPDFSVLGRSDRDVMIAAIVKADSKFAPEGKSDEYLRGRFDVLVAHADSTVTPEIAALGVATVASGDAPKSMYEDSRARAKERSLNAWKTPLTLSVVK